MFYYAGVDDNVLLKTISKFLERLFYKTNFDASTSERSVRFWSNGLLV